MTTVSALTDDQKMRREIATFLDGQLVEEMKRRGLLRTMAITSEVTDEASDMDGFIEHAERRMASDLGRALAEHRAITSSRAAGRYGLTLQMELTVLLPDPPTP